MKNDPVGMSPKALLLGHFSTVGDVACLDFVIDCLREQGMPFDSCAFQEPVRKKIPGCLAPGALKPGGYSHLIFICGPCWPELFTQNGINLRDFAHACRIAINTTMIEPTGQWNPFHHLLERDSERLSRPDLAFFTPSKPVPVVGLCLISEQLEYGNRQRHQETIAAMRELIERLGWARLELDTRWPVSRNAANIRNPAEFCSLVQRVDLVVTNRLHGLVFALKTGVPVLAVDSIAGGDKVSRQARAVGWRTVFLSHELDVEKMMAAARWCVSDEGRQAAQGIARAIQPVGDLLRADFLKAVEAGRLVSSGRDFQNSPGAKPANTGLWPRLRNLLGILKT